MKKTLISLFVCLMLGACINPSQETSEQKNITQLNWELIDSSGNATVAPPWQKSILTVKSDGTISHITETYGGDEDENGTVTDWSAQMESTEISELTTLIGEANIKSQQSLRGDPDCVGGGYTSLTYKENGTTINSFTISSGCDYDLGDSYPKLDELLTKMFSLGKKYTP